MNMIYKKSLKFRFDMSKSQSNVATKPPKSACQKEQKKLPNILKLDDDEEQECANHLSNSNTKLLVDKLNKLDPIPEIKKSSE